MIRYAIVTTSAELEGIMQLQKANLQAQLDADEIRDQGFVTVSHSPEQLRQLHSIEPSVIALQHERVVGYVLAMTAASRHLIPVLEPMFDVFESLAYLGRSLSAYPYMVIGQVCVAKSCRGMGVFDELYATYRRHFQDRYAFAVTEIATRNTRSIKAHERIGFRPIHTYRSPDGEHWTIVILPWNGV